MQCENVDTLNDLFIKINLQVKNYIIVFLNSPAFSECSEEVINNLYLYCLKIIEIQFDFTMINVPKTLNDFRQNIMNYANSFDNDTNRVTLSSFETNEVISQNEYDSYSLPSLNYSDLSLNLHQEEKP